MKTNEMTHEMNEEMLENVSGGFELSAPAFADSRMSLILRKEFEVSEDDTLALAEIKMTKPIDLTYDKTTSAVRNPAIYGRDPGNKISVRLTKKPAPVNKA